MNLEYFPHFIRINYPSLGKESNETLTEIGKEFKSHLEEIFVGKMDKLALIWNIDAKHIIMNEVNKIPFLVNGYHPALIIHFEQFVEKIKKEAQ